MDFNELVGLPIKVVEKKLTDKKIIFKVTENLSFKEKYDTILVVKVNSLPDVVEIVTDKFLLNI